MLEADTSKSKEASFLIRKQLKVKLKATGEKKTAIIAAKEKKAVKLVKSEAKIAAYFVAAEKKKAAKL
jgi:hypothetical protein